MAKDAVATMGNTLPDDVSGRDAVHVAVFSAVCSGKVYPGQHVGIVSQDGKDVEVGPFSRPTDCVAIVDPFLNDVVPPGERFWAYLYPRTITSLSHRWTHPALDDETAAVYTPPAAKLSSEQWLRKFCEESDCPSYEIVMGLAAEFVRDGEDRYGNTNCLHVNGTDAHGDIPPEFWEHVAVVLGVPVPEKAPTYFSCSC